MSTDDESSESVQICKHEVLHCVWEMVSLVLDFDLFLIVFLLHVVLKSLSHYFCI